MCIYVWFMSWLRLQGKSQIWFPLLYFDSLFVEQDFKQAMQVNHNLGVYNVCDLWFTTNYPWLSGRTVLTVLLSSVLLLCIRLHIHLFSQHPGGNRLFDIRLTSQNKRHHECLLHKQFRQLYDSLQKPNLFVVDYGQTPRPNYKD